MATPITSSIVIKISFRTGRYWYFQCANKSTQVTATVPKMAPLAPIEGRPTNAKLPPRMLPNIPAQKYVIRNPVDPISLSICAETVS